MHNIKIPIIKTLMAVFIILSTFNSCFGNKMHDLEKVEKITGKKEPLIIAGTNEGLFSINSIGNKDVLWDGGSVKKNPLDERGGKMK